MFFPVVDLALLWPIGRRLGLWPTVGMLASAAVIGGFLVRAQGMRALREVQEELRQRRSPEVAVISGFLVLAGAMLLAFPGPLSDVVGLLLLFPPTRTWVAGRLRRRCETDIASGRLTFRASGGGWQWRSQPEAGESRRSLDPEYHPDLINDRAAALIGSGETAQAMELWERSLEEYACAGTPVARGAVLNEMATALAARGDVPRALAALDEALTIFSSVAVPGAMAAVLGNRGNIAANTGDLEAAIGWWRRGAAIQLQEGDDRGRAITLTNMASAFVRSRKPAEAMPLYQQALALFETIGDEDGRLLVVQSLSVISDRSSN
jgi:UPF0716 family protein affecting phage T7 exclusion